MSSVLKLVKKKILGKPTEKLDSPSKEEAEPQAQEEQEEKIEGTVPLSREYACLKIDVLNKNLTCQKTKLVSLHSTIVTVNEKYKESGVSLFPLYYFRDNTYHRWCRPTHFVLLGTMENEKGRTEFILYKCAQSVRTSSMCSGTDDLFISAVDDFFVSIDDNEDASDFSCKISVTEKEDAKEECHLYEHILFGGSDDEIRTNFAHAIESFGMEREQLQVLCDISKILHRFNPSEVFPNQIEQFYVATQDIPGSRASYK